MSCRYYDESWDKAHDLIHEISRRHDFDTTLSITEFYHKYYHQLTSVEHAQIEELLNKQGL